MSDVAQRSYCPQCLLVSEDGHMWWCPGATDEQKAQPKITKRMEPRMHIPDREPGDDIPPWLLGPRVPTGWQCPVCKLVHSPTVSSCSCSQAHKAQVQEPGAR